MHWPGCIRWQVCHRWVVQAALVGLNCRLAQNKELVTADMSREMLDSMGQKPSLSDVRLWAVCAGLCVVIS